MLDILTPQYNENKAKLEQVVRCELFPDCLADALPPLVGGRQGLGRGRRRSVERGRLERWRTRISIEANPSATRYSANCDDTS